MTVYLCRTLRDRRGEFLNRPCAPGQRGHLCVMIRRERMRCDVIPGRGRRSVWMVVARITRHDKDGNEMGTRSFAVQLHALVECSLLCPILETSDETRVVGNYG